MASAAYDRHAHGPGEDMGLEELIGDVWLGAFLLLGIVLTIRSIGRAGKQGQSPAIPFFALLLYAASALWPFIHWLFFS